MKTTLSRNTSRRLLVTVLVLTLAVTGAAAVYAAGMGAKKVVLSNQNASATGVGYSFTINPVSATSIKCFKIVFGTTQGGSTVPTGMTTTGGAQGTLTGVTGSWASVFTANGTITTTNATGSTPTNPVVIPYTGITNSSSNGTYFASVSTFTNVDCATGPIDTDDVAFVIAPSSVTVTASVNETLTFSLGTTTVALGTLSTGSVATGTGNMAVATNAANGYGVNASGSTLTKGADTIPFVTDGTPVAAGTAGYGLRVSTCAAGATCSSTQDIGSGLVAGITDLIARTSPTTGDTSTVTYRASIDASTPAGAYSSTISYVAVGKF